MPDMPYVPSDSMNLMGLYFSQGSATPRILSQMRKAIFLEQKWYIPYSEIVESQGEIAGMRRLIDGTTPYFAQDLNALVLGKGNRGNDIRTIFLTTVDYLGPAGEIIRGDVVIPINLGTNPWLLYRGEEGYDSIDTKITAEQAEEFVRANGVALRELGVKKVFVKTSGFFYVRDEDLRGKRFITPEGAVDLASLTTYLYDTRGFVGLENVQKPTEEEYKERAVPFTSYRQKQTLIEKVEREICQYDPFKNEGDVISDWGAHRITATTEEDAMRWGSAFRDHARVGRFETTAIWVDDYYSKPKGTGFKSYNIAVRATSTKHKPTIREIQIYDLQQHFNGQINEKSHAYHGRFRRSQTESSRRRQELMRAFEYVDILKLMFNARELEFKVTQ